VFTETALARMEAQRSAAMAAVGSVTAAFELPSDTSATNGARNNGASDAPAVPSGADSG
jgi:arginine decarboxylase